MNKKYYVTTPIYYASGDLHIGHCFCTVLADACARFKRLDGYDVMFLTGSDEHGMKVMRSAEKAGLTPKQFVDKTVANFKKIWELLGISYDKFIRTTDKEHEDAVALVMQKLFDSGDIYLGKYEGLYCVPCETYFTESQLINGNCPDCGRPVELTQEKCYFLRLSKYQKFIEDVFKNNKKFLVPDSRKNEIYNNFIKDKKVQDLCITRTTFDWGIKTPFDKNHVVYVWCDALLNYITALGYGSADDSLFKKYWPADVQFVGRDITRFHTVIWPIMLHAIGVEIPKQIHSTGFITLKGDRIAKSKSNGFSPTVICEKYGADALRYYMLKEGPIYNDVPYTSELFLNTINSDLCNDLGNLVSRTLAMISQSFDGIVPKPNKILSQDKELINLANSLYDKCVDNMNNQRVDLALKNIFEVISASNKYIDITTPWLLAKTSDGKERLKTVLYVLCETIRICTTLLQSFLIEIPNKIFAQFNTPNNLRTFISIKKFSENNYGIKIEKGDAIFKRIDIKKDLEFLDNQANGNENKSPVIKKEEVKMEENKEITIDEFDKIKLLVGRIIASERVEGSEKLLKNTVEIGEEKRTIVSGIAKYYNPEDIIGKEVVVVSNLKPIKLKGILSEGMILCAVDETNNKLKIVSPESVINSGSKVC